MPDEGFAAHEWGTFTSVQGGDGIQLEWNPFIRTDLPGFVYNRNIRPGGLGAANGFLNVVSKGAMPSFVRMETPVIYFYSEMERTVDATVNFVGGRITEWYPQATRVGPYQTTNKAGMQQAGQAFIEWAGLKILPRGTKEISADQLIREKGESHYYSARETDANFLRMASPHARNGPEYERDLFYRGVGFFQAPLTLTLQGNENHLQLSTKYREPLTDMFVLTVRNGMARYQSINRLEASAERVVNLEGKPFAPLTEVQGRIMAEMKAALVKQGLYAKEAQAMVDTWKDQWFAEEGVRVLYLLPRAWTEATLPLTIKPRPKDIVRVMVGRAELITPAMEWELNKQVVLYSTGRDAAKQQAVSEVRKLGLGRFIEPAIRKMLGRLPSREFSQAAWNLAQESSKEIEGRPPTVVEQQPSSAVPRNAPRKTASLPSFDPIAQYAGF